MNEIRHWINNKPYDLQPERWGDVFNPATGLVSGRVALAGVGEDTWTPQFAYWRRPAQMDDGGANLPD